MATWVKFAKAAELPEVQEFRANGRGNFDDWRKSMIAEAQGSAVFARYASGFHSGDLNIEVDIDSASVAKQ